MFFPSLVRSFTRSGRSARRRRVMKPFAPTTAEVLETRLLLAATLFVDPASSNPAVFHTIQGAVNAASAAWQNGLWISVLRQILCPAV